MHKRRGFTIVELVIVMVIMAILLGLGFVSLTRSQANARDAERDSDAGTIARGLETRYKEGNPNATSAAYALTPGSYPGGAEMAHIIGFGSNSNIVYNSGNSGAYGTDALPGTSIASFSPPDVGTTAYNGFAIRCLAALPCSEGTVTVLNPLVTKDTYLYEPIDATGNVCNGDITNPCVRFNLYWRDESSTDTSVDSTTASTLHVIRSKHQ